MKYLLHIPIEQYGFVSVEIDKEGAIDAHELKDAYNAIKRAWDGGDGITDKEMNMVVDCMLLGQTVKDGVHIYERMSDLQKYAIQTIKRAMKRQDSREQKSPALPTLEDNEE